MRKSIKYPDISRLERHPRLYRNTHEYTTRLYSSQNKKKIRNLRRACMNEKQTRSRDEYIISRMMAVATRISSHNQNFTAHKFR